MTELRKDYVLDRFVVVATERAKRPDQFKSQAAESDDKKCFFCPGHEHETPEEITRLGGRNWQMRVFENKFPAVQRQGKTDIETHNELFTFAEAVGRHEIIVETPKHTEQIWDFDAARIKKVLKLYKQRIKALKQDGMDYVSVFKNQGKEAGASLRHSHTQIIAGNMPPSEILQKEEKSKDSCPYCTVIEKEKDSLRCIRNDEHVLSFAPYASRFLFEAWLFPKRHVKQLNELNDKELTAFSEHILSILSGLKEMGAPYNMYLQEGTKDMHFHIVITPRLANWAGFELSTGIVINQVPPEIGEEFYR